MDEEYTVRMKVDADAVKGRTYHRLVLEIELPEELHDYRIVPAFVYGSLAYGYQGKLFVHVRKLKKGGN